MPMTSPFMLTSAPPELPGLIGASVWMASPIVVGVAGVELGLLVAADRDRAVQRAHDAGRDRALQAERAADGEHRVAHLDASLSPHVAKVRPVASTLSTARSVFGSVPTTVAETCLPLLKVTFTLLPRAPCDDMVVGDDVAVRGDHHAGALTSAGLDHHNGRLQRRRDRGQR